MLVFKEILDNLVNIIYPARCFACGRSVSKKIIVCDICRCKIEKNLPPFCPRCGRNLKSAECVHCKKLNFDFRRAFSPCRYSGVSKELIHRLKYRGKVKISAVLAEILVNFVTEFRLPIAGIDIVTPVPLHCARLREREFNQAELLSKRIAEEFKIRHSSDNLIRVIHNQAQARLDAHARFKNIRGSFKVKDMAEFCDKNILLIDDVLTTGATCSEAARALKGSGAKNIVVLTFAS